MASSYCCSFRCTAAWFKWEVTWQNKMEKKGETELEKKSERVMTKREVADLDIIQLLCFFTLRIFLIFDKSESLLIMSKSSWKLAILEQFIPQIFSMDSFRNFFTQFHLPWAFFLGEVKKFNLSKQERKKQKAGSNQKLKTTSKLSRSKQLTWYSSLAIGGMPKEGTPVNPKPYCKGFSIRTTAASALFIPLSTFSRPSGM